MKYCVNNIDEYMSEIQRKAPLLGWSVYLINSGYEWILLYAPDFFQKYKDGFLKAAKKAMEHDCSLNCDLCYQPHPMLQIDEHTFVKLCTSEMIKIDPKIRKVIM